MDIRKEERKKNDEEKMKDGNMTLRSKEEFYQEVERTLQFYSYFLKIDRNSPTKRIFPVFQIKENGTKVISRN